MSIQDASSDSFLTTHEVAALLRIHPKQVYRLLRRGLPGRRLGVEWRFVRSEVIAWMANGPATAAADALVDAEPRVIAQASSIHSAAPPLLAANGDLVIEILLEQVNASGLPALGFVQSDRERAIRLLQGGAVIAAGCHGNIAPTRVASDRLARLHLVGRDIGLVGPARKKLPELAALPRLRFAVRPATAGVVTHLRRAVSAAGLEMNDVLKRSVAYESHRDVVCAVLRGEADVGLSTAAWAHRVGLSFKRLATESYGLLVRGCDLGTPAVVRLCETAQSSAFRKRLAKVPGYDPAGCGDIRYDPEPAS